MAGRNQDRAFAEKLRHAISKGDIVVAKRLIKGGVDINATLWYDGTLLHEAVTSGKPEIVKLLLNAGADLDKPNQDGRTALHFASRIGNLAVVKLLLDADAHVNAVTRDRKTSLHVALWRGHSDVALDLLNAGARVNARDEDGWTPLHWAVKDKSVQATRWLVERGASVNMQDNTGHTALHTSLAGGSWNISQYLLKQGANPQIKPALRTTSTLSLLLSHPSTCTPQHVKCLQQAGMHLDAPSLPSNIKLPGGRSLNSVVGSSCESVTQLCELCRFAVRKRLNEVHGGRSLLRYVHRLPVPGVLQDYLALKHELSDV